jgi:phosphotransferase system enzyme I (PtsI)
VPLGAMIEVPAAAIAIDAFLKEVDFVSIGSNDLIQYLMAVDRNNARVAALYQQLNPSVLRTIASVIEAANAAGREVSLCGEMAGNFYCTLALLGMGLRRFSMARHYITGVGRLIRAVTVAEAQETARRILSFSTTNEVRAFLHARTREIFRSIGVQLDEDYVP